MPIPAPDLKLMLLESFPGGEVEITSLVDDNDHFHAVIRSQQFQGKSRVAQHQMVYAALKGKMGGELHALSLKTEAL